MLNQLSIHRAHSFFGREEEEEEAEVSLFFGRKEEEEEEAEVSLFFREKRRRGGSRGETGRWFCSIEPHCTPDVGTEAGSKLLVGVFNTFLQGFGFRV
jgi:hypothetical protein